MSEHFITLQNTLRKIKENGVDLTHPHGVKIGTKIYPAIGKNLTTDNPKETDGYNGSFHIPLENGLHVRGGLYSHGGTYQNGGRGHNNILHLSVMAPVIYRMGTEKVSYGYQHSPSTTELVQFGLPEYKAPKKDYEAIFKQDHSEEWISIDSNHKNPHDAIAHFSKRPYHGFTVNDRYMQGGGYRNLNNEELTEHKENNKLEPNDFPKNIAYNHSHPAYGNSKFYNYDVLTEQLRER